MASELDKFLDERRKFDIPKSDVEWVRMLAREMAMGVHKGLWPLLFQMWRRPGDTVIFDENLKEFGSRRWEIENWLQPVERLHGTEYIVARQDHFTVARAAFDLLQEAAPADIFISYRRKDSSALALLVNHRLQQFNLQPFVDMALEAGGNWHADLEERIRSCDLFHCFARSKIR